MSNDKVSSSYNGMHKNSFDMLLKTSNKNRVFAFSDSLFKAMQFKKNFESPSK